MNSRFFFVAALGLALAPVALAQDFVEPGIANPNGADLTPPGARPTNVVSVDADNLAQLPSLLARAGAISLGVYAADLDKNPAARDALLDYVGQGGTVFLHTDAAQLFGYRTVAARETTARLAGQIYGSARAAVPFGTVPLLWNSEVTGARGPVRAPGINRVYYTLRAGDDLVVDHPAGTPLLQVGGGTDGPLYAAAIAPYGAGWAVFTPDFIDQTRGDGAAFARNLLKLTGGSRYVGISQAAIADGNGLLAELSRAARSGRGQSAPLPGFGTGLPVAREGAMNGGAMNGGAMNGGAMNGGAMNGGAMNGGAMNGGAMNGGAMNGGAMNGGAMNGGAMNGGAVASERGPVLLLTRAEATAFGTALQNDPQGRGAVALAVLRSRVALLNGDGASAQEQLNLADRLAPDAGEIPFLRGTAAIADARFVGAVSGDRAVSANLAATSFAAAGRATPFFANTATGNVIVGGAANVDPVGGVFYGDIAGDQLGVFGTQLNRFAQVLSLEPPLSRVVGNGASAVTIRYFANDTTLPFVERTAAALASSELFRDSIDGQEILLFPTPALYRNYRLAAGLTRQNVPLPADGALGDVVDGRILMYALPAARPVAVGPGGVVRPLALRATAANVLARFEAFALIDFYVGDGQGRVPSWMSLGLSTLADLTVNGDVISAQYNQELQRYAALGSLLAPQQFNVLPGDSSLLAQAQSLALMRYLYAEFGAGRVAETLQRIGAGQSVDDALVATTGFNEIELFRAWREAQFAGLNLRN